MNKDFNILGSGWAGLLAGERININGNSCRFLDKDDSLGGLLKSEIINGFTFDTGGPHLLFSKYPEILDKIVSILGNNILKFSRNNYVLFNNSFIQYPFENGLYMLGPSERVKIIKGIIQRMFEHSANKGWEPKNFKEWSVGIFGDEMANQYLIPYNKKIWKRPLEIIASDWVTTPGRLPYPDLENLLKALAGIPNIGYKEQAHFYYPKKGGIQSLYNSLYMKLMQNGSEFVKSININTIERTGSGEYKINSEFPSSSVISTIPLPEAVSSIDSSSETKKLVKRFDWNSVIVVGVAISKKTPEQTTIYVPDEKIIFHRYTWMSSLAKPKDENHSNLIAEITIPKGEHFDRKSTIGKVISDLANIGVLDDEKEVLFSKLWFNNYGYPIYTLDHNEVRAKAMNVLGNIGIKSLGRWGSWHYWNTDMVYKAVSENIASVTL
ncbi:MAG: NAD(P)-binding protein [Thermoplasmatales archaeon]